VTISGEPLFAVPYTHGDPLAVRIESLEAVDRGNRYDIRYMAYGPGEHDLGMYVIDENGQRPDNLPELTVTVDALLEEDASGELFDSAATSIDLRSNYQLMMGLLWVLWLLLLVPLFLFGRKTRARETKLVPAPTVPERLRDLLQTAETQLLSVEQQADLEQLLISYWTNEIGNRQDRLVHSIDALRDHPVAGEHIKMVEEWLHARRTTDDRQTASMLLEGLGWSRS